MFKNAEVGDKVWSVGHGWGKITHIDNDDTYPLKVKFDGDSATYTLEGKFYKDDLNPTLFWDEVKIVPPPKPLKPMTQAEYLADSGKCPYCRSFNIHGDSIDISGNEASQAVMCHACTKNWTDTYKLVRFEEGTD